MKASAPESIIQWKSTVRLVPTRFPSTGILDRIAEPEDLGLIIELNRGRTMRLHRIGYPAQAAARGVGGGENDGVDHGCLLPSSNYRGAAHNSGSRWVVRRKNDSDVA